MIPTVSAGSNHVGAMETCTAVVSWPSGAASADDQVPSVRSRRAIRVRAFIDDPPLHRSMTVEREDDERTVKVRGIIATQLLICSAQWEGVHEASDRVPHGLPRAL